VSGGVSPFGTSRIPFKSFHWGKDGNYGSGGFLPLQNDSRAPSLDDADNLTDFSGGRLRN
jgi:hypothetical protein